MIEEHLNECEESQKVIGFIEANRVENLSYDNENSLQNKGYYPKLTVEEFIGGYQSQVIKQIKSWGLINKVNLPNLKEKNRIGVINILSIIDSPFENRTCEINDLVVFLAPRTTPIIYQNLPKLLKRSVSNFFYSSCGSRVTTNYEKIVVSFFIWRLLQKCREWNHNIYVLRVNKNDLISRYTPILGNSATMAIYLTLLSYYYQKPISQSVAATGFLNIGNYYQNNYCPWCFQEEIAKKPLENLTKNKIGAVGCLEYKIPAAVKAGIKKLILSAEQKEEYEKNIPQEFKEKLKVYYVKDVEELEELFWQGEFS